MNEVFTVAKLRPARDGMTISRNAQMGSENSITYFALGKGTSISQERYDTTSIYIGADGNGTFLIGTDATWSKAICWSFQVAHSAVCKATPELFTQKSLSNRRLL